MEFTEISPWDFSFAPFALVGKEKMLLSATDARGTNVMTVAWGGFGVMWGAPCVFFAIRPSRYTYSFAEAGTRASLMALKKGSDAALSYCGTHSGREENKLDGAGLTPCALPSGGFAVEEAEIVFDLQKLYSHRIAPTEFWSQNAVAKWYDRGDFHMLYVASVEKIYLREPSFH